MGDPRRFWKESIGVTGPVRPKSAPARPGAAAAPPTATPPASGTGAVSGPATGVAGPPTAADTGAVTGARRRPAPESVTGAVRAAGPAAGIASAHAVEEVLFGLPLGSIVFGDEVARRLWAQPAPADLKALATLLEHQREVPPGPLRELVVRAVALRQRVQRLLEHAGRGALDPVQRAAHAAEWSRLARVARETGVELDVRIAEQDRAALKAAAKLLPDPEDVEAEAALAGEASALVDADPAAPTDAPDVPEARDVLAAMRAGQPRPLDALFLDVLACWSYARRAVQALDIPQMERARRVAVRVGARMDALIARLAAEHRRDPEGNARLATWRRYLVDARTRIDETLTRPAPGTSRLRPRVAEAAPAAGENRIVEHLREVRRKAAGRPGAEPAETPAAQPAEATPKGLVGWLRRMVKR